MKLNSQAYKYTFIKMAKFKKESKKKKKVKFQKWPKNYNKKDSSLRMYVYLCLHGLIIKH